MEICASSCWKKCAANGDVCKLAGAVRNEGRADLHKNNNRSQPYWGRGGNLIYILSAANAAVD